MTLYTTERLLAYALIAVMAAIGAYDIYAYFALPPKPTVSFVVQGWLRAFPVLAVGLGVLLGHLLWPSAAR